MSGEFNLSDEIVDWGCPTDSVREFIKLLKENIISGKVFPRSDLIIKEIDKLAGDKLI